MQEFAGKVAVVTGAASGVGRALAETFARAGMRVVLADAGQAALDRVVDELRAQQYDVTGVATRVSQLASVQALAGRALEVYGKVHVVCNNAGADGHRDADRPIWEATERDWLWTFGVNFWGVVYGARTFMPILLAQDEEAHMLNVAGATRHAVVALTETMSDQLARRDTRVGVSVLSTGARGRGAASATPPARVAEIVLQAIKDRQLYIRADL
ncbi:MAG TPA: SDR family NAD(P)-dependent oxidoreductase [Chloroflexota bacterium]|nr:SDR family NAD(P)-dependent oxidoreductase [Chloroflexota bacterium]